jgi:hypothetical protein
MTNAPLRLHPSQEDAEKFKNFEQRAASMGGGSGDVANLLEEMRQHTKALERQRKHEDPRLSFTTPEYKEFSRKFGRAIEWGMVRRYPWSSPQLVRLDVPVDPEGNPWPLDENGKPIEREDPTLHREVSSYKE